MKNKSNIIATPKCKNKGKKLNERICKAIKASGEPCNNYICSTSDKYCKIHFLKKLHSRMIDKEDTIMTMASPVTTEKDVWIGSLASAQHKQFLKKYGIKSILNVSGIEPLPHTKKMLNEENIIYHTFTEIDPETKEEIFMPDSKFDDEIFTKADFLNYAAKAIKTIKSSPKPILVNCQMGMNRSAAMIAAYLICVRGYSFDRTVKALEDANKKRGIAALKNVDFRKILKEMSYFCELERMNKKKNQNIKKSQM